MFLKKAYLLAALIPVIISCATPGGVNNNTDPATALSTKADALKYFECALNNPSLTEEQKTTIRSTVIAQISAIPEIAWAQAKVGFEAFAKTYGCSSGVIASASPGTTSPGSTASPAGSTGTLKNKEEYRAILQCAYDSMKAKNSKELADVMLGIEVMNELNASRFLDDNTFISQKTRLQAVATKFQPYCTSATPVASATPVKVVSGVTEYTCDAEKTLKSASGASINISFTNNTSGKVKLYWLDNTGSRKVYNASLAKGATHAQQTFVTHPWLVTDENEKCLKIFLPSDASSNGAKISI